MNSGGTRPRADSIYYHVAADSLQAAQSSSDRFARAQSALTTMVFSAMSLEAFANEQCHMMLPNLVARFEKWSARRKWQELSVGLGGERFAEAEPPYAGYLELLALRNDRLVHFKPWKEERWLGREYREAEFLDVASDVHLARNALSTVGQMIRKLHDLTGGRTEIPQYLDGSRIVASVWRSLSAVAEVRSPESK